MMHFDKNILDYYRKFLFQNSNDAHALDNLYDLFDGLFEAPPIDNHKDLLHDLLPEIVNWFDTVAKGVDVMAAINEIMDMIDEEGMHMLAPFVHAICDKNKIHILKTVLSDIRVYRSGTITHKSQLTNRFNFIKNTVDNLNRLKLNWPELEIVRKGLMSK